MGHVDERHARGLCEHRRCVARMAEVDALGVQRFEQLRSCREPDPLDTHAELRKVGGQLAQGQRAP